MDTVLPGVDSAGRLPPEGAEPPARIPVAILELSMTSDAARPRRRSPGDGRSLETRDAAGVPAGDAVETSWRAA